MLMLILPGIPTILKFRYLLNPQPLSIPSTEAPSVIPSLSPDLYVESIDMYSKNSYAIVDNRHIENEKSLYCWGRNDQGIVGDGTTSKHRNSPKEIDLGLNHILKKCH